MEEIASTTDADQEHDVGALSPEATNVEDSMRQELDTPALTSEEKQEPKGKGRRFALIILGVIFVGAVTFGTYYVLHAMQTKNNTSSVKTTTTTKTDTAQKAPATATDAAIDTSLNSIDSGITQATTDQSSASSAVSDSDQQITVPTE